MVPPSLSNNSCWKCGAKAEQSSFCPSCGVIQDVPLGLSHFQVLGFAPTLRLDTERLREAFYELSRKVHPDKFASAPAPQPSFALRWSTAVNRAYQTLRDPSARAHYLLELENVPMPSSPPVPLELAEAYFDLQDLLSDDAEGKMAAFRADLIQQMEAADAEWNRIAGEWDATAGAGRQALAKELQGLLTRQRYLRSMILDLDRKGSHGHRGD